MGKKESVPIIELIEPADYEAGYTERVREQDIAVNGIYALQSQLRTYGISALSPPHPIDTLSAVVQVTEKIETIETPMTAIETDFLDQDLENTGVRASWHVSNGIWKPLVFRLYNLRAQNQTKFGHQKRLSRAVFEKGYAKAYDNGTGPGAKIALELGLPDLDSRP